MYKDWVCVCDIVLLCHVYVIRSDSESPVHEKKKKSKKSKHDV